MKIIIIFLISFASYAQDVQDKFVFTDKNIKATVIVTKTHEIISQTVEIENLTDENIFFPKVNNNISVYHYSLENNLYSYNGVMNSLNGSPSLGGTLDLIRIEPRKTNVIVNVNHKKSSDDISSWIFTFDYVIDNKKINLKSSNYTISSENYFKLHKYLSYRHISSIQ